MSFWKNAKDFSSNTFHFLNVNKKIWFFMIEKLSASRFFLFPQKLLSVLPLKFRPVCLFVCNWVSPIELWNAPIEWALLFPFSYLSQLIGWRVIISPANIGQASTKCTLTIPITLLLDKSTLSCCMYPITQVPTGLLGLYEAIINTVAELSVTGLPTSSHPQNSSSHLFGLCCC